MSTEADRGTSPQSGGAPQALLVLIPAYAPSTVLVDMCRALHESGVHRIVVVDDGSPAECKPIFDAVSLMARCTVLRHAVNLGKGRALKTGLNHIYLTFRSFPGVVTADADGQHACDDILEIGKALCAWPEALIIGTRGFSSDVPLRSLLGNVVTKYVFYFLVGQKLSDTQSGLRGIPMSAIPTLLRLEGEQYEYEMNMLITSRETGMALRQISIKTIYIENNQSSHFNPFFDSMKIYFVLLRFGLSSFATTCVDQVVFFLAYRAGVGVAMSMVTARLSASVVNLLLNRRFVFKSRSDLPGTVARYYGAMAVAGIIAYSLIEFAHSKYGWSVMQAKICIESLLFFVSFVFNRDFVFLRRGV